MKAFKNKCLYLLVLLLVISCAKDEEDWFFSACADH